MVSQSVIQEEVSGKLNETPIEIFWGNWAHVHGRRICRTGKKEAAKAVELLLWPPSKANAFRVANTSPLKGQFHLATFSNICYHLMNIGNVTTYMSGSKRGLD
jgi:hypothetical protein